MKVTVDFYLIQCYILGEENYTQRFADSYLSTSRLNPNSLTYNNKILQYNYLLKNCSHVKFALPQNQHGK